MSNDIRNLHGAFSWGELLTTDVEAAASFYQTLIGWRIKDMPAGEMGVYKILETAPQQGVGGIMALPPHTPPGVPPHWGWYITVDDIDAVAAKAKELGASLVYAVMEAPGVGRMTQIRDPQGAHVSFIQYNEGFKDSGEVRNDHGAFSWGELMTRDVEASQAFYSALLGWDIMASPIPGNESETYHSIKIADNRFVGGMMKMPAQAPESAPPYWAAYVTVSDLDASVSQAKELGATLDYDPVHIPGVGRMTQVADPQGARLSLIQYEMSF